MNISNYTISGIINQKGVKDEYKYLITFYNQKLNLTKQNYNILNYKLFIIIIYFWVWQQYFKRF